jgi:hypothetical protein
MVWADAVIVLERVVEDPVTLMPPATLPLGPLLVLP